MIIRFPQLPCVSQSLFEANLNKFQRAVFNKWKKDQQERERKERTNEKD